MALRMASEIPGPNASESRALASSLVAKRNPTSTRPPVAIAAVSHRKDGCGRGRVSKKRDFRRSSRRPKMARMGAFKNAAWTSAPTHHPCQMANASAGPRPWEVLHTNDPTDPPTAATNDTTRNQPALWILCMSNGTRAMRYASAYTASASGSTRAKSNARSGRIPEYRANENVARYAERNAHSNPSQKSIHRQMTSGG